MYLNSCVFVMRTSKTLIRQRGCAASGWFEFSVGARVGRHVSSRSSNILAQNLRQIWYERNILGKRYANFHLNLLPVLTPFAPIATISDGIFGSIVYNRATVYRRQNFLWAVVQVVITDQCNQTKLL